MFWMFDDDIRFHLDTDEGGGAGDSSDPEEEPSDEEPTDEPAEPDDEPEDEPEPEPRKKGEGPPEGSKRWNKVYAGYKMAQQYAALGAPHEVAAKLQRAAQLEERIAKLEDKGKEIPSELKEKQAALRKQLHELEPALAKLDKIDQISEAITLHEESLRIRAAEAVVDVMEKHNLDVDEETFNAFAGVMDSILQSDKRLYTIYATNPERAVQLAYKKFAEPLSAESDRKKRSTLLRSKRELDRLPKSHRQTSTDGSSGPKPPKEAQSIEEALEMYGKMVAGKKE